MTKFYEYKYRLLKCWYKQQTKDNTDLKDETLLLRSKVVSLQDALREAVDISDAVVKNYIRGSNYYNEQYKEKAKAFIKKATLLLEGAAQDKEELLK